MNARESSSRSASGCGTAGTTTLSCWIAQTGIYFDPDKMHYLHHKGKFFSVRGPLNIARPPQGRPVIIQAGGSEAGKELAAETAEVIFTRDASMERAQQFYADVKGRMGKFGRPPDHLKIMAGLTTIVGRTTAEAEEKFQQLQSMIHPVVGLEVLSEDLEGIELVGPAAGPADPARTHPGHGQPA